MYKVEYKEENNVKAIEADEKNIIIKILELYDKILKITDNADKVYDKRDILDKEENRIVDMLNDTDSKEELKNKLQKYVDSNREYMKEEIYNNLTEKLNKLYETEDKIQLKIKFINLYFKWN